MQKSNKTRFLLPHILRHDTSREGAVCTHNFSPDSRIWQQTESFFLLELRSFSLLNRRNGQRRS
jgi:hypothetical protein